MDKGDIVLTLFPFSDLTTSKCRPALVISNTRYNKNSRDIVLVAISSQIKNKSAYDILLSKGDSGFNKTGLKTDSLIKTDKIIHLEKKIIKKKLGSIDVKYKTHMNVELKKLLDL
jgi:mRNA interferase MazF